MLAPDAPLAFGCNGAPSARPHAEALDDVPRTPAEIRACKRIASVVAKLPASGSVIIVHSPSVVDAWRRCVRELRGDLVAAETRVIVAPRLIDERAATTGLSALPVFRDSFVELQREHRRALAQAWRL
ncbi:hypothetical protein [Methylobacterium gnaphalii]|uniref:Uncharacterized protein n=1 Tax=Methylobacterium gnaphalii TaxID=1010610 RepID=A0A512JIS2_9HYPH|nr:hypothetical protein [Methylobacterium gnaphalii]GEP09834.1 hypothetical protein MGN01_16790 [Methylobacterium gnaphalii]GJD67251.1 hypothetical protein MMMDOFMJ_0165 [Methylobacterium gnaphalii]GLS49863.1 hypothetical protein GCM10007885_27150 [Methylobacterium gnaphalii]